MGLKVDSLPNFSAATSNDVAPVSSSERDLSLRVNSLVQSSIANGFIQAIKDAGSGNAYIGVQKIAGSDETSAKLSPVINTILSPVVGKALAQSTRACNAEEQAKVLASITTYLTQSIGSQNWHYCLEKIEITGKISYSYYKDGDTYYIAYSVEDRVITYFNWVKKANGDCVLEKKKNGPADTETEILVVKPDGSVGYGTGAGIPRTAKLLCKGSLNLAHTIPNPKFDKEKCCGKNNIPPTEQ